MDRTPKMSAVLSVLFALAFAASAYAADKPVKTFVVVGQSNTVGVE